MATMAEKKRKQYLKTKRQRENRRRRHSPVVPANFGKKV